MLPTPTNYAALDGAADIKPSDIEFDEAGEAALDRLSAINETDKANIAAALERLDAEAAALSQATEE